MKFCQKCGKQIMDEAVICPGCGCQVGGAPANNQYYNQNNQNNQNYNPNYNQGNPNFNQGNPNFNQRPHIAPRSIVTAIILTIVTCGIYGLYWFVKLTDESNWLAGTPTDTSGGMSFVLSLVTCGIYQFVWAYKMGQKVDRMKGVNGSSGVLYLVLSFFGLGIVVYCLAQDSINKCV